MRRKRREPRILKLGRRLAIIAFVIAVIGNVYLSSYELTLNAKTKEKQDNISQIQADIDGLEIKRSELASFDRLKKVATSKGYTYKQGSTAAVVESDEAE